jgi:hypothetical protein
MRLKWLEDVLFGTPWPIADSVWSEILAAGA